MTVTAIQPGDSAAAARWYYALAAVFFLGVATLGSLAPFQFEPQPLRAAAGQFGDILARGTHGVHVSRVDWLSNLLLFVPVGFCLLGMVASGRSLTATWTVGLPVAVGLSLVASVGIEFSQMWFPNRTPAVSDIVAQTIGTLCGAAVWLFLGRRLPGALRDLYRTRRPFTQFDYYLVAYFLVLTLCFLYPLDLSIHPGQILQKYRRGLIVLRPFSDWQLSLAAFAWSAFVALAYVPVGMLAAGVATTAERPKRQWPGSVAWGGLLVAVSSAGQVLVVDRRLSTTTTCLAMVGVLAGIAVLRRWVPSRVAAASNELRGDGFRRNRGLLLASAGVYAALLVAVFCFPFDWQDDTAAIRRRLAGLMRMPLDLLYQGSPLNAAKEILRKGLLFLPLGVLLGLITASFPGGGVPRRAALLASLAFAGTLALAIELAQALMQSHYPDSTDVLLYFTGAAAALWVTLKLN